MFLRYFCMCKYIIFCLYVHIPISVFVYVYVYVYMSMGIHAHRHVSACMCVRVCCKCVVLIVIHVVYPLLMLMMTLRCLMIMYMQPFACFLCQGLSCKQLSIWQTFHFNCKCYHICKTVSLCTDSNRYYSCYRAVLGSTYRDCREQERYIIHNLHVYIYTCQNQDMFGFAFFIMAHLLINIERVWDEAPLYYSNYVYCMHVWCTRRTCINNSLVDHGQQARLKLQT